MTVIWSDEATAEYLDNIEYLIAKWSINSATDFISDVDGIINAIKIHPELFPIAGHKDVRRAVIRKQITMFYRATTDRIEILRIWNNYKDPKTRNL